MEKFLNQKESIIYEAPPPSLCLDIYTSNNIYYNCTECSSLIDIISINEEENIIEFKCLNKKDNHGKKIMSIEEYLTKMEKYKNKETNNDICNIHNKSKYISYCFDCNEHLCTQCLKKRTHINHKKITS